MFDPNLGRFTTMDPSGFDAGDVNLYRALSNAPVSRRDPSGLADITDVESDNAFGLALGCLLGRVPTKDEIAIGNQGCVGLAQLALGTKSRPHLEPGTRCFEFDTFPTFAQLQRLQAKIGGELKCGEGQVPRMFLFQFWEYHSADEIKKRGFASPRRLEDWKSVTEIDPRTANTNAGPDDLIRFDFITVFRFEGEPGHEFFLHMNKGRVNDKSGCVVKRSKLDEVKRQYFTKTVVCLRCGPPAAWHSPSDFGFKPIIPKPLR